ncbi:TAXI family TRAP transporter solute-binding subunit [Mycolicibacterium parafortuitum]|uniref:TRAP transporter solute receptor TAXI family protein [Nocardia brasiliensis ATCC] n=1 Tax=Mycolicibacterium parafortuitum TaxID=39692 RepID=A0A375YII4_MYCPF|nr:TAXI family TRAP transporter solute-binding subunit [Mycolicibacterium parafortuitum]ORB32264.1 C4-dicarboxylate ABC transporter substrate-binding protein [Mycolicibacterium parafortuitum]SRX80947.1 TRAP transporter solute receptor TAXI family protein [Nocardia brasiliensis ATCC] [Mycolicibacterium parafortuitum]
MKRTVTTFATLMLAAAAISGCGGRQDAPAADSGGEITCEIGSDTRVSIATGNSTGVYFSLGNAFAEQLSAATGGKLKATAAETGASVQNIQQLVAGSYQVAFSLADTAADAVDGKGSFDGAEQPIQALSRIYPNYTQVVVRADSGITSVGDMRGKRVSTGSPGSGTEVIANRLLEAAGLNPRTDVAAQRLDLTKTVDGMKDGAIDAMFWSGGLPTPGITDLFTSERDNVRFIDVTPQLGPLAEISIAYEQGLIPAEAYGLPSAVPTIVVPNVLLVRDDLDANLACVLTKTLFEKQPELANVVSAAKGISLEHARETAPVPLNRGAELALDELNAPK